MHVHMVIQCISDQFCIDVILVQENSSQFVTPQVQETLMVFYPGLLIQPSKIVVSIKMNQQTNAHKKLFRANTTSLVFKDSVQNRQCECRPCPVHVTEVRSKTFPNFACFEIFACSELGKRILLKLISAKRHDCCSFNVFSKLLLLVYSRPIRNWTVFTRKFLSMGNNFVFFSLCKNYAFFLDTVCKEHQWTISKMHKPQLFVIGEITGPKEIFLINVSEMTYLNFVEQTSFHWYTSRSMKKTTELFSLLYLPMIEWSEQKCEVNMVFFRVEKLFSKKKVLLKRRIWRFFCNWSVHPHSVQKRSSISK